MKTAHAGGASAVQQAEQEVQGSPRVLEGDPTGPAAGPHVGPEGKG